MKTLIKIIIGVNLFSLSSSVLLTASSDLVFMRQLFSGRFIGDTIDNNPKELEINENIENLFKYGDKSLIKDILSQNKKDNLKFLLESNNKDCRVPTDHPQTNLTKTDCLARAVALEVSPFQFFNRRECGLSGSISKKINSVNEGVGCCSDFNQSFMLHSGFIGLKVREVSNSNHTGSEYFDPASNEWKWIDTSYRTQITNKLGKILSAYKIYNMNVNEPLHIVNTYLSTKKERMFHIIE